jgi:hypothetical protein
LFFVVGGSLPGGKDGPALGPGNPEDSFFMQRVSRKGRRQAPDAEGEDNPLFPRESLGLALAIRRALLSR